MPRKRIDTAYEPDAPASGSLDTAYEHDAQASGSLDAKYKPDAPASESLNFLGFVITHTFKM